MLRRTERPGDQRLRHQEAHKVAEDYNQHAIVKQIGTELKLPLAQHLRGIALPRVRLAIEPDEAPDQQDDEAYIGVNSEQERVQVVRGLHGSFLSVSNRSAPHSTSHRT